MIKNISNAINYQMIENTSISSLPLNDQVNFLLNTLTGNKVHLNKTNKNTDNFYYSTKAMEIMFTFPDYFVDAFYKKYPYKDEFNVDNSDFPSVFLAAIAGIDGPHYSERDFIINIMESAKNLGLNLNAKTPAKSDPLMKTFERFYISNLDFSNLKKGFSCNKNIVDLALDTYQYELAIEFIEKYNIKPSVDVKIQKRDMLNYILKILTCDQDPVAVKSFNYRESVDKIVSFFKVEDKYSMYDLLINNKNTTLKKLLNVLLKEEKLFREFDNNYFPELKDASEIVKEKLISVFDYEKNTDFKSDDVVFIKSALEKISKKYDFISDISLELSTNIEKIVLCKNLINMDETKNIKRL